MRDILSDIVENKKNIVAAAKERQTLHEIKARVQAGNFAFSHALHAEPWSLIAECKLQSPSKGRLCHMRTVEDLARIYDANGASILSVHTDPHFLGSNEDFRRVRALTKLPLLRKDFIIDPYQIYEARLLGADAVLLIVRILTPAQLKSFLFLTWELGMDALVEAHDAEDVKIALQTPAEFIGLNNRNLRTFETSIQNTLDLLPQIPQEGRTIISESGIFTAQDALTLKQAGAHGILVGEGLVRAEDIAKTTRVLKSIGNEAEQTA